MGNAQANIDETMMQRALVLAARGTGFTAPNPMVGCVIARNGEMIGEGWHRGRGWDETDGKFHAEVNALTMAGENAHGATAYVTLEPCNHYGTTPPCARALIEAGIARVVIAMADPNRIAANGAKTLRDANITVEIGLCEDQARALNRAWLHGLTTQRPFVIAKFAASLDGKIATHTGDSQWITGPQSRARAHELRQMADAIIVGAGTVLADNPALTSRSFSQDETHKPSHPLRVILDSKARTSPMAKVYHGPGKALLVISEQAPDRKRQAFEDQGTEILVLPTDRDNKIDLNALMPALYKRDILTLMVEGGSAVLGSFFDDGLIDEVWAFLAPMIIGGGANPFGGAGASTLNEAMRLDVIEREFLGDDILIRGQIKKAHSVTNNEDLAQEGAACSQAL